MASNTRRSPAASSAQAEVVLLPSLKSCLLNLPSSLVALLLNSNTIAQNVVVELSHRQQSAAGGADAQAKANAVKKSVFLGWTGMQSQPKLAPVVGRDGIGGSRGGGSGRQEQEVSTVEIDSTFGRLLGLSEGMKVGFERALDDGRARLIQHSRLAWHFI